MSELSSQEVTHLLLAWRQGEKEAFDKLIPVVYQELRRLAHGYMRGERKAHTFQTNSIGQRSLSPAPGLQQRELAEPGSFPAHLPSTDKMYTGRLRTFLTKTCALKWNRFSRMNVRESDY